MSKHTELNEALVTKITNTAAGLFPSFGGGSVSPDNPVSHALKDAPAMFAAGVDVSAVVRLTLIMSGQPDLLAACRAALEAATVKVGSMQIRDAQEKIIAQLRTAIAKATT